MYTPIHFTPATYLLTRNPNSIVTNCIFSFLYVQSIERSHNGRVDECFVAMLEAWFKKGSPSWSVMVEALRAPSVDRRGLANNIEKKFMNNSE